jgi:uncharacterized protein (TIGR00369 family)
MTANVMTRANSVRTIESALQTHCGIERREGQSVESQRAFEAQTPDFAERVQSSFAKQTIMHLIGAELGMVLPGEVQIQLPFRADLTQQHGFLHAGIVTAIADSACGYAALSLMPAGASVLTVEFKVNLLAPAKGESFVARGTVIKPGRTITVCSGEVYTGFADPKLVATMTATIMQLHGRAGVAEG